jgi:hypothetical protein
MTVTWLHQTDYRQLFAGDTVEALLAREYGDKQVIGWGVTELMEGATHVWVRWTR